MNKSLIVATVLSVFSSAGLTGLVVHQVTEMSYVEPSPPAPPPAPVVKIDEEQLALRIADAMEASRKAEEKAVAAQHQKKNCDFWGGERMPGC